MRKGLFIGVPSLSISKTLIPVIDTIARHYDMLYYNTAGFMPSEEHAFRFRPYPPYRNGYNPDCMDGNPSLFGFGEILGDTSESLLDFLLDEVEKEKPDFILHSHLAMWGRLLARCCRLPAICLYTTIILDKKIMQPHYRKINNGHSAGLNSVRDAISFYRKMQALHSRLQLPEKPDVWDVVVNREDFNLSFILPEFQPQPQLLGPGFVFMGHPVCVDKTDLTQESIYVSLGSMINNDIPFYKLCLRVLGLTNRRCIISVGRKTDIAQLGTLPPNITVLPFVDQVSVLNTAALFITRGGSVSLQEAVYTHTPIVAIPATPEQELLAERIAQLGIGLYLPAAMLNEVTLESAVVECLRNNDYYAGNIRKLLANEPDLPVTTRAFRLIDHYLDNLLIKSDV